MKHAVRFAYILFAIFALSTASAESAQITNSDTFTATASWYGGKYHGRKMANGERFDMFDPSIVAHRSLPLGTVVRLTNPQNGTSVIAVVKDRLELNRFDLSYAAAQQLGFVSQGITRVVVEVIH